MVRDESDGGNQTEPEIEAGERANRKYIGRDGVPHSLSTVEQKEAANRTKTTVTKSLSLGPQETGHLGGKK